MPTPYLLLDAAKMELVIEQAKELNANHRSLYKGEPEEDLAAVAPYLFTLDRESPLAQFYIDNGWGEAWGLIVKTYKDFDKTQLHFRRFLMVKTEDGRKLYFRFYDPRVLRIFLPTCDAGQLKEFFGPIEQFICEDEDPQFALVFSLVGSHLQTKRIPADDVFRDLAVQPTVAEVPSVTTEVQGIVESSKPTPPTEEPQSPKRRFFVD